jgi:hypothetical protein
MPISRFPKLLMAAATASVFAATGAARATEIYIPTGTTTSNVGGRVVGTRFTYSGSTPITFRSLGFIDLNAVNPGLAGPDGLLGSYLVGLWDYNTQALLASTLVTPTSPLIPSGFPSGQFRYSLIEPTTISPGQTFIVGALLPNAPADAYLVGGAPVNSAGFSGASGYFVNTSTLDFPSQTLGPGAMVANASTIPEPATISILLVPASIALFVRRRRAPQRPSLTQIRS